jgi:hypothetical protein
MVCLIALLPCTPYAGGNKATKREGLRRVAFKTTPLFSTHANGAEIPPQGRNDKGGVGLFPGKLPCGKIFLRYFKVSANATCAQKGTGYEIPRLRSE